MACLVVVALLIGSALAFQEYTLGFMLQPLSYSRHFPEPVSAQGASVYVLGGTTDSLRSKLEASSRLVHDGKAERVLVQSRQALMSFSPDLNRNLSADEWARKRLADAGVPADRIEFVALEEGFFGTWSEAKALSRIAKERGLRRLVLMTAPYHSRRVWESFSHTIEQPETRLFLYHSNEPASLRLLLPEYVKLSFYRILLF
jgi:uncharacterized SAM-binding protein YcdF (DUF218 family)